MHVDDEQQQERKRTATDTGEVPVASDILTGRAERRQVSRPLKKRKREGNNQLARTVREAGPQLQEPKIQREEKKNGKIRK